MLLLWLFKAAMFINSLINKIPIKSVNTLKLKIFIQWQQQHQAALPLIQ
jgi:hypothetical protein